MRHSEAGTGSTRQGSAARVWKSFVTAPEGRPFVNPARLLLLALAWVAMTGILVGVGTLVTHSGSVQSFDSHVTSAVVAHRSTLLDTAMKAVTWLGSWIALAAASAVLLVLVLRRRLSVAFFGFALIAGAGAQGATTLAKHLVQRPRPPESLRLVATHGWSWPSGHAATAMLVFTILAMVVWVLTPEALPRRLALLVAFVAVVSVASSRVELGVHWTTDVAASIAFVAGWLLSTHVVLAPLPIGSRTPEPVHAGDHESV
jgi:membrane-associated phospholipid phosphatase